MVEEREKLSPKDFPEKTLGHRFPNFESFYKELKPSLGFAVLKVITKVEEDNDGKKTIRAD
jgi:hypothetical protein